MGCVCFSDFIVKVKVESEFIDDYSSLVKGQKNKNNHENNNLPGIVRKYTNTFQSEKQLVKWFSGEAHLGTMETFQSYFQTSQDTLRNEHVKEEPRGSPPKESSKAAQLLDGKPSFIENTSHCFYLE